jgi:DAK2 domain fusion protein YloV
MTALTSLSAADVSKAIRTFDALLRAQKEVINHLNVYPVPDGDTGTNMSLTMSAVVTALSALPSEATLAEVTQAISSASLMGARGNSGVILSQLLRGITKQFPAEGVVDVTALQAGLTLADELARQAVSRPVEGTILSVARAAAQGAATSATLEGAVRSARDAAKVALAFTPEQLPVLKQAGVVDSGGTGLVLWFDALCHVVAGDELPVTPARIDPIPAGVPSTHVVADTIAELRYEVMFLLDAPDEGMALFRSTWESLGDSIVIVGGDGFYNCHIHTDHIGATIEAGIAVGRPRDIRVTDLLEQAGEEGWTIESRASSVATPAPNTAVVAVALGDGVADLFLNAGATEVVSGGQTMNPSTADLVAAVEATGATNVIVLPNNKNIRAVAEQVDALVDASVRVVPTTTVVAGLASMIGYRADGDLAANAQAMTLLAADVVAGEVTQAVRDTQSDAGDVHVGDWIGLSAEGIVVVAPSLTEVTISLAGLLATAEHELCTILTGEGSDAAVTAAVVSALAESNPDLAIEVHDGGQPLYPYLFGFE